MYQVVDNFLPKEEFDLIKNVLISNTFPWYYNSFVTDDKDTTNFYFSHSFFEESKINSNYYSILNFILSKLDIKALIRAKGNLYYQTEKLIEHGSHADYNFEHKGAIFYINTNDGFTVLENNIKIESVENRLLFFEPHKMHNSTNCTDKQIRVNINFNYF